MARDAYRTLAEDVRFVSGGDNSSLLQRNPHTNAVPLIVIHPKLFNDKHLRSEIAARTYAAF